MINGCSPQLLYVWYEFGSAKTREDFLKSSYQYVLKYIMYWYLLSIKMKRGPQGITLTTVLYTIIILIVLLLIVLATICCTVLCTVYGRTVSCCTQSRQT